MERLNVSLDPETLRAIRHFAKQEKIGVAEAARRLVQEAVRYRARRAFEAKLRADYAESAKDPEVLETVAEATAAGDELFKLLDREDEEAE